MKEAGNELGSIWLLGVLKAEAIKFWLLPHLWSNICNLILLHSVVQPMSSMLHSKSYTLIYSYNFYNTQKNKCWSTYCKW